jgi:quercetin dioxygenase-like cupin family protein
MPALKKWGGLTVAILCAALTASHTIVAQGPIPPSQDKAAWHSRIAFSHTLPQLAGDHLSVSIVEVVYGPGDSSLPHSHPCPVIGYVVEGALRMQVKGEPEAIYRTGESFYEAPYGVHLVSANASDKEPAKLIAYFVCDHDTSLLSVPAPKTRTTGEK